jgi:arylsulfatase A-like enzyme
VLLPVALALASSIQTTAPASTRPARPPAHPNIVVILTDDQRWDTLWAMPNVQNLLVDHGVTFNNAFVSNSLCCPSRVAMLTGQYSHTSGVYTDFAPNGGFSAFNDSSDIATWIDSTYRTGLVGKYLNDYEVAGEHGYVPAGWDRFAAFTEPKYYGYDLNINGNVHSYGYKPKDYSTYVLADQATRFIKSTTGPMFLWFAPNGPHSPEIPAKQDLNAFPNLPKWRPPSYNESDVTDKPAWMQAEPSLTNYWQKNIDQTRVNEYRTLLAEDRSVGQIVDALASTGKLSNTMIVFASDNGFQWGEHRLKGKQVAYDESIRIPMVVRYDPLTSAPSTDNHLVVNIDFAPTFADLAGVAAPGAEGTSFMPILDGSVGSWRTDFLLEHLGSGNNPDNVPTYCGVRTSQYTYVRYKGGGEELYDLSLDPYEMTNVASSPSYAGVRDALRLRLAQLCVPPPPGFTLPIP